MNDIFDVQKLNSLEHLYGDHEYSFEIKLFITDVKKFLKGGAQ